jgi:hypothetical protein
VPKVTIDVTPEQIVDILRDLPPEELRLVLATIGGRLEVREWMRLQESAFQEWLTEPELYGDEPSAR